MKKHLVLGASLLAFVITTALRADDMSSSRLNYDRSDLYRPNELSLDLFGTDALDKHTISHPSGDPIRHDSRLGLGLGVNYFILRYVGIGAEAYSEDTRHNFVDNISGSIIGRIPIGNTGLAPYAFGGGGHQFDPVDANLATSVAVWNFVLPGTSESSWMPDGYGPTGIAITASAARAFALPSKAFAPSESDILRGMTDFLLRRWQSQGEHRPMGRRVFTYQFTTHSFYQFLGDT